MTEPRQLKNAPVTEALIDFRVKARAGLRPEEFLTLKPQLAHRFPKVEERRRLKATVQFARGKALPSNIQELGPQGYFFKDESEKIVAQFRVDGFTLNRLRPYTSWEDVFPQAMELWGLYVSSAKPEVVTRLAVRYINHIQLPRGAERFEDYLRAAPTIPPELPQYISGFITRVTIHDPTADMAAHITQALEGETTLQQLTVLFDIDAFKQEDFSPDSTVIEGIFGSLRAFKNRIFFNSLTEEMLRYFE